MWKIADGAVHLRLMQLPVLTEDVGIGDPGRGVEELADR